MGENRNLDHIRAQAANWTLKGDADLLEALVKISKDVVEKAESSSRKVDDLCISLDRANCDLQNTTNSFTALANQQFMENRVAEEEPVIAAEERKNEPEISAAERNKKVRDEVLRNSLAFLDENFDLIQVPGANESDDEQSKSKLSFQVKNPSLGIKIPFVIGSKEYEEDDFIGLRPAEAKATTMPVEVNWGSGSFDPSISSEEDARSASVGTQQSNQSSQKSSFVNELQSAAGGESPPEAEVQVTQPKIRSLMSAYDQREPPPLFGGQEDEEEGTDTIFGSGANLFKNDQIPGKSKFTPDEDKGSLFADDEDDNLFDEAPPQPKKPIIEKSVSKPAVKLPAGAVSIFGNNKPVLPKQRPPSTSSKGSFDEPVKPAQSPVVRKEASPPSPSKTKRGLFDDDSDDDLFAAPPVAIESSNKVMENSSSKSSLFGDSMEEEVVTKPADKPAAVNSSTNVIGAPKPVPKKLSLFGDSDSDEDIFSAAKPSSSNLFGDETEDLFKPTNNSSSAFEDIFGPNKTPAAALSEKTAPKEDRKIPPKPEEAKEASILPVKPKSEDKPTDRAEIKKRLNLILPKETPKVVNLFESPETEEKTSPEKHEKVPSNKIEEPNSLETQEAKTAPPKSAVRRGLALNINPLALLPGSKPLKTPTPSSPKSPPSIAPKEPSPVSPPAEEIPSPRLENNAPNVEAVTPASPATFDDVPVSSSQLVHPGKDRIKIKQKRKPPTRKGRQASVESPSEPSTSNLMSPATDEDDLFIVPDIPPVPAAEEKNAPSVAKEAPRFGELEVSPSSIFMEPPPLPSKIDDLFGDEDDYLFNDPIPASNEAKVDARLSFEPPPLPNEKTDTPSDDLFAEAAKSPESDELFFAPAASLPPDLPKATQESQKVAAADIFDEDDLFGPPVKAEIKPQISAIETPKESASPFSPSSIFNSEPPPLESSDDIFGDDDLFSDALSPNSSSDLFFESRPPKEEQAFSSPDKPEVFLTPDSSIEFGKTVESLSPAEKVVTNNEPASLFDEDDDDDDLFGAPIKSISTPKPEQNQKAKPEAVKEKSSSPPKVTKVKNQDQDLFAGDEDDDDDLFGPAQKSVPTPAENPAKQTRKAELASASKNSSQDLFGDSSKQNIIKQKKELIKKKSSALFGDLDDEESDLFGSSVTSTAPPKQQAQPRGQEKKKTEDLFDDPLLGGM